ncbi:Uncharacterised protein [Chlamydia trachomatis]|nr:Uncharacterised protein [Chlamydia trachomatis]
MPKHIEVAKPKLADASIPLEEEGIAVNGFEECLGDRFACKVMLSEGAEELGLACPILIEVRWELHEVVHHVGTAKGGIGHLCKEPV